MYDILAGLMAMCPCIGAALLWRAERKVKAKPTEERTLDCGCADRGVSFDCPDCGSRRCNFHRDFKHVCLDRDGDLIPAEPNRAGGVEGVDERQDGRVAPAIVAGPQLRADFVAEQFAALAKSAADLDDLDVLAEYYLLPEVTP